VRESLHDLGPGLLRRREEEARRFRVVEALVHDRLEGPATVAGDDGQTRTHRFKRDDAQVLVNGGVEEGEGARGLEEGELVGLRDVGEEDDRSCRSRMRELQRLAGALHSFEAGHVVG
jgi:hypothetical protein